MAIDPSGVASAEAFGTATLDTGTPRVGIHGLTAQTYGSANPPVRVSLSGCTPGSLMVLGRGGMTSDQTTAPTDSVAQTWSQIGPTTDYTDFPGYGRSAWLCRNLASGNLDVDCTVTLFDEHTVSIVEVLGELPYVQDWSHKNTANADGGPTITSNPVTTTRSALLLAHWWGAGYVGYGDHVVTAAGWTVLELYGEDNPNGYVQHYLLYRQVFSAGVYDITVNQTPTQGAQLEVFAIQSGSITPPGIPSAETVGNPSILATAQIHATGMASVEGFGSAALATTLTSTGIPSGESHGTTTLTRNEYVSPSGVSSAEAAGTSQVARIIAGSGTASVEIFGTATLARDAQASAIPSTEEFGSASFTVGQYIEATGTPSAEAIGLALVEHGIFGLGIITSELLGASNLSIAIAANGLLSASQVAGGVVLTALNAAGIDPTGIVPTPVFSVHVDPIGIDDSGTPPSPALLLFMDLTGTASGEAFGTSIVLATIRPTSVASGEALGDVIVDGVGTIISPLGISNGVTGFPTMEGSAPPPPPPPEGPVRRAVAHPEILGFPSLRIPSVIRGSVRRRQ